MSRIGKLPVHLPQGVTATVDAGNVVMVKGPLGQLSQKVDPDIKVSVEGNIITVSRPTDAVLRTSPVTVPCTDSTAHSFTTW